VTLSFRKSITGVDCIHVMVSSPISTLAARYFDADRHRIVFGIRVRVESVDLNGVRDGAGGCSSHLRCDLTDVDASGMGHHREISDIAGHRAGHVRAGLRGNSICKRCTDERETRR